MPQTSSVADIVAGVIALLLIATVVLAVTRRLKLPFTVVLVLVGIGLSALSGAYPHVLPALHDLEISSALIFYVFLPTLIFESAFNLDARQLRENLGSVLVLAGPGLLLSTMHHWPHCWDSHADSFHGSAVARSHPQRHRPSRGGRCLQAAWCAAKTTGAG